MVVNLLLLILKNLQRCPIYQRILLFVLQFTHFFDDPTLEARHNPNYSHSTIDYEC